MHPLHALALTLAGAASMAAEETTAPPPGSLELFESSVRPLLVEHCYHCHSAEADARGKGRGGLRLDSRAGLLEGGDSGPALVPGDPAGSRILEALGYLNEDLAMPPKAKLPEARIAAMAEWVRLGAPWPESGTGTAPDPTGSGEPYDWARMRREHWAFRPVVKPLPPPITDTAWPRSEIDRFVLARLEASGMRPSPPAEKHLLLRRATLDLTGLPPTPEQVEAFLADSSPEAFAKVVDGLLASPHHGEAWARHWLDVARYSDGHGGFGDSNPLPAAWRYRDWVVGALNADMPFDRFVTRQIAGDLLGDTPDPLGTGFFVVGPTYTSDGGDPEAQAQAEAETLADRVDTFSRAFLGLTAACARCHHHKFDPITTEDYYAIAGIFRSSRNHEYPLVPQAEVEAFNAGQQAIAEQDARINGHLDAESTRLGIERQEVEKALDETSRDALAGMRDELERLKATAPKPFEAAHGMADGAVADMPVALRGDLRRPGGLVPRRFLRILAGDEPTPYTRGSGRLELAQAVVAPENPLTARVIVNRVWGWHFGEALVRTPGNFGLLGEKPTHPELLDWLAADFVANGWSLKRLHRQILLSSTWQMDSRFDGDTFARDGDNRLLWRMSPRKLGIEAWRDSLLAVTGELDRTVGGPPAGEILGSTRRTLYATISRTGDRFESDAFLRLFDFPAAVATSDQRVVSTVPQQYLFMLNSPFMTERARTLGDQLHRLPGSLGERVTAAYRRLYSRPPEAAEIELAAEWLGENPAPEAWHQYAQVLLSAHELIQIR